MDDLLALMNGSEELPEDEDQSSSSSSNQPSAATTTNHEAASIHNDTSRVISPTAPAPAADRAQPHVKRKRKSIAESVETKVDSRLGIRMMNRKIGSLDLLELVQTKNYNSPSTLAAMSLAALNQQLVEPALVVGSSTVNGNTSIYTIGIVFSNSGTKIAAKGNAFCILQIGSNLQSGPTVSVLLFGPAYSQYCKQIKPGCVIAVENPRLLPQKSPDQQSSNKFQDAAISFSINDEKRLYVVAQATDYGVCQASIKGKNAEGHWVSNARRCTTAIDTRTGKYCHQHRNLANVQHQQQQQAGTKIPSSNNHPKNGTFVQQQRRELNMQSLRKEGRPLILPNNRNMPSSVATNPFTQTQNTASTTNNNSRLPGVPRQMNRVQQSTGPSMVRLPPPNAGGLRSQTIPHNRPTNNSLLNASKNNKVDNSTGINNSNNRLLHLGASNDIRSRPAVENSGVKPTTLKNPYVTTKNASCILTNSTNQTHYSAAPERNKSRTNPILDWLPSSSGKRNKSTVVKNGSTKSITVTSKTKTQKSRKLNTSAMGGFDGGVAVPKPSQLFAASHRTATSSMAHQSMKTDRPSPEDILFKQQQLAQQLAQTSSTRSNNTKAIFSKKEKTVAKSSSSSFFGSALLQTNTVVQNMNRENVLNAKSRFANEADAEAYAASRKRVTELEQEEAKKEALAQKKENGKQGDPTKKKKVVEKEWICKTCNNRSFKVEPKACKRARHSITMKRLLNTAIETQTEKRLKLTKASAQDGGLVLGSGLDWTRANYFGSVRFS